MPRTRRHKLPYDHLYLSIITPQLDSGLVREFFSCIQFTCRIFLADRCQGIGDTFIRWICRRLLRTTAPHSIESNVWLGGGSDWCSWSRDLPDVCINCVRCTRYPTKG